MKFWLLISIFLNLFCAISASHFKFLLSPALDGAIVVDAPSFWSAVSFRLKSLPKESVHDLPTFSVYFVEENSIDSILDQTHGLVTFNSISSLTFGRSTDAFAFDVPNPDSSKSWSFLVVSDELYDIEIEGDFSWQISPYTYALGLTLIIMMIGVLLLITCLCNQVRQNRINSNPFSGNPSGSGWLQPAAAADVPNMQKTGPPSVQPGWGWPSDHSYPGVPQWVPPKVPSFARQYPTYASSRQWETKTMV
eukprot:TRINITY_DN1764_c0_g1_i1.p1 TRINITY_DN1764_c0_g1~~TRINITY_DN1764_c0_g1_i1.p1  ORF type:complete len:250 (+),score=-2.11 TRINITY_DN1764_c0_g1_i1:102-851(+)